MNPEVAVAIVVVLVAVSVFLIALVLLSPILNPTDRLEKRLRKIAASSQAPKETNRDAELAVSRRKAVQESLKQLEISERQRKRVTVRRLIAQAGLNISVTRFWLASVCIGLLCAGLLYLFGAGRYLALLGGVAGVFGLPRWWLIMLRNHRQRIFLMQLPDAVDIIVRGLKSGLPINDALLLIATEMGAPLGPEIREIVEGQRVGIPLEQGLERLHERVPLPEVNFLTIVMGLQSKTGGNLSEALTNLSKVLRDRKRMAGRIRAVSQEAKSSAAILGSLPPMVIGLLYLTRPDYISLLWDEPLGRLMLAGSALWMLGGVLVMRKMINFKY